MRSDGWPLAHEQLRESCEEVQDSLVNYSINSPIEITCSGCISPARQWESRHSIRMDQLLNDSRDSHCVEAIVSVKGGRRTNQDVLIEYPVPNE